MYLSNNAILKAVNILHASVHPFIGITFVACKNYGLSIGSTNRVSLDTLTRDHMDEHHRLDRRSTHYFQPFKSAKWWVNERYPSSGLQTINTQTFGSVFLHPRAKPEWGFKSNYIDLIVETLEQKRFATQTPVDALAVWLFKDVRLSSSISDFDDLSELFLREYRITEEEQTRLFPAKTMAEQIPPEAAFVTDPLEMTSVVRQLPESPDSAAEGGRTITSLQLLNAGPAREMTMDFGQRQTIITGDNGLGKSFLLDFTWWAATGQWADQEALPQHIDQKSPSEVKYTLTTASGRLSSFSARFDRDTFEWKRPKNAMTVEALAVFSRADGSFALADPIRGQLNRRGPLSGSLTASEVWDGKAGVIEGIIRDWNSWQSADDRKTFDQFATVLKRLSPEDLGTLTPGSPVRLPGDPREIPTVRHRYGTVPITHASSGVQRVLLLSYLIIWSWQEHELAAKQTNKPPLRRMMVIVDELEAHLHPKWQRIVLPALMRVGDLLSSDLAIQMVAATHSPMVLASMESVFDPSIDMLYHLSVDGSDVKLEEFPFVKYGDATGWLTSPLFGLQHARSREAERAIEDAKALQLKQQIDPAEVAVVSDRLKQHLASDDRFWPRWLYFAEQNGVTI